MTIEEKMVRMSLDNASFLSKIKQTVSSMSEATQSAKKVDNIRMDGISNSLTALTSRFSTFGIAAATVVSTLTTKMLQLGKSMVMSTTIGPMKQGLSMYENKLKSIQTILANTQGKSNLGDVTKSLGDLNEYANKTVYSFEDMTTNMGTFTAAGVDLKTAQTAIKGIGNLAAASGSSTQQAGMAMYQLSQAIAAGKVGLQDWNSVVNAGMGGKKFQTALQDTAKSMGKNIDKSKSFRDSLQEGWLTTDVLMKTLDKFSKDKSMLKMATQSKTFSDAMDTINDQLKTGWADTWEAMIGGYEEAPKLWTAFANTLGDMVGESSKHRVELLKNFDKIGGRKIVIDSIKNAWQAATKVADLFTDAMHDVFPPQTAGTLKNMAEAVLEFTKGLKMSKETASQVKTIFKGFFSLLDIGIRAVKMIGKALLDMIPDSAGSSILDIAEKLAKMIIKFDDGLRAGEGFTQGMGKIKGVGDIFKSFGKIVENVFKGLVSMLGGVPKLLKPVATMFTNMFDIVKKSLKGLDINDLFAAGGVAGIFSLSKSIKSIGGVFDGFMDKVRDVLGLGNKLDSFFDTFGESLKAFTTAINARTLLEIAAAIGIIAVSINMLSNLKFVDISKGLEVLVVSMIMLKSGFKALSAIDLKGSAFKSSALLMALSTAILNISVALNLIAAIDTDKIGSSLLALAGTVTVMVAAIAAMSKINGKMTTSAGSVAVLSVAILGLSVSLAKLSEIKPTKIANGLGAMAGMLVELGLFVKAVNGSKLNPGTAVAVTILAAGLAAMGVAVAGLGMVNPMQLAVGLGAVAAMLAEIAIFSKAVSGSAGSMLAASAAMVVMAAAIGLMAPPVILLGSTDMNTLASGLLALGGALGIMVLALNAAKGTLAASIGIAAMAVSINLITPPLLALSQLSLQQVGIGLLALGGAFAIIGVSGMLLGPLAPVLLAFAAAIGAVALALAGIGILLTGFGAALTALGAVTTASISVVMTNLGSILTGLQSIIPQAVALVGAFVVALAVTIASAAPAIAQAGLDLILGLLQAISDNIYPIITTGGEIVYKLIEGIATVLPDLIQAGVDLIIAFIEGMASAIRDNGDQIVQVVLSLIESILEIVVEALTRVVEVLFGWIPGVKGAMNGLGKAGKEALRGAFDIDTVAKKKGDGFVNGISSKKGSARDAGSGLGKFAKNGVESISLNGSGNKHGNQYTTGVNGKKGSAKNSGSGLGRFAKNGVESISLNGSGSKAGNQFTSGVNGKKGSARSSGSGLGTSAKGGAGSISLNSTGSKAGGQFNSGVNSKKGGAHSAGSGLKSSAKSGASGGSLHGAGSNLASGFAQGISDGATAAIRAAASMASGAVSRVKSILHIKSPSRVFKQIGRYVDEGFAIGIGDNTGLVMAQAANMANSTVDAVRSNLDNLEDVPFSPTINPVITDEDLQRSVNNASIDVSAKVRDVDSDGISRNVKMVDNGLLTQLSTLSTDIRTSQESLRTILNTKLDPVSGILDALKEHYGSNEPIYLVMNDRVVGSVFGPVLDQNQGSTIGLTRRGLAR